jgi:hypothetical protein
MLPVICYSGADVNITNTPDTMKGFSYGYYFSSRIFIQDTILELTPYRSYADLIHFLVIYLLKTSPN